MTKLSKNAQAPQCEKTSVSSSTLIEKAKDIIAQIFELTVEKSSSELDKATDAMYRFIDTIK